MLELSCVGFVIGFVLTEINYEWLYVYFIKSEGKETQSFLSGIYSIYIQFFSEIFEFELIGRFVSTIYTKLIISSIDGL